MDELDLKQKRDDHWHFRRYVGPKTITNPATWPNSWLGFSYGFGGTALGAYLYNRWYKRPWFSAMPYRLAMCFGFGSVGFLLGLFRDFHMTTRDAVVEHYMSLHPEDFAHLNPQGGRKLKDLFLPWDPVRVQERFPKKLDT